MPLHKPCLLCCCFECILLGSYVQFGIEKHQNLHAGLYIDVSKLYIVADIPMAHSGVCEFYVLLYKLVSFTLGYSLQLFQGKGKRESKCNYIHCIIIVCSLYMYTVCLYMNTVCLYMNAVCLYMYTVCLYMYTVCLYMYTVCRLGNEVERISIRFRVEAIWEDHSILASSGSDTQLSETSWFQQHP